MKKIDFPNGKFAIYDDEFEDLVNKYIWSDLKNNPIRVNNTKPYLTLVNLITQNTDNTKIIIHINKDKYDCRLSNLNITNRSVLTQRSSLIKKTNKYRGVQLNKEGTFRAVICKNYKRTYLGTFLTEKEAAEAYNKKAKELYGELSYQNKI